MADFLTDATQFKAFGSLTEAVRKGGSALPDDPALRPDSPYWVNFAHSMAIMMRMPSQSLAALLTPQPQAPCKVLDVAAGHGLWGMAMAQRNPQAEVYGLDWPAVLAVAKENAARMGVGGRYHTIPGSAFEVEMGAGYDWVLLPNFLHHFDIPTCTDLLRRVHAALKPGGKAAIVEFVVDETRLTPPRSALFSLLMLASTPAGDAYSSSELAEMVNAAGFRGSEEQPLDASFQNVVIATK